MPAISTATADFADDMPFIGFAEPEPDAVPLADSPLAYHQLNGDQWDSALSGLLRRDGTVQGRWLASVRLPYYMQRSWLLDSDDTRQFFMATAPNADPASSLRVAVGLLEVEKSPYDEVLWVKYVTVHPDFQRQGIATALYQQAADFSLEQRLPLQRSRPGINASPAFTASISRMLDAKGVSWTQSPA